MSEACAVDSNGCGGKRCTWRELRGLLGGCGTIGQVNSSVNRHERERTSGGLGADLLLVSAAVI